MNINYIIHPSYIISAPGYYTPDQGPISGIIRSFKITRYSSRGPPNPITTVMTQVSPFTLGLSTNASSGPFLEPIAPVGRKTLEVF